MEVHFSPDVETRLQQVASANGKDAEQLVKDTVARMLENQAASSQERKKASSKPTAASL
jgi:predicted transcriptional regulator